MLGLKILMYDCYCTFTIDEGWPRQCPWIKDLGSGGIGALGEFEDYQINKANLTIILRQC
jgi:hypothetical protein